MNVNVEVINTVSKRFLPYKKIAETIKKVFSDEKIYKANISVVIVDDISIKNLNLKYLQHDYPTDVLAFQLGEDFIEGDIYISYERASHQAVEYNVSLTNEILRLAIHGTLHLLGYNDKTKHDKEKMTKLENKYLNLKL